MQDSRDEPTVEEMERMQEERERVMREREKRFKGMVVVEESTRQRIKGYPVRNQRAYDVLVKKGPVWLLVTRLEEVRRPVFTLGVTIEVRITAAPEFHGLLTMLVNNHTKEVLWLGGAEERRYG